MNDGSMDDGSIKGKVQYNRQQATQKKKKSPRMKIMYQCVYHVILF